MSIPAFIALLQNAAWLLAMVVVFDLVSSRQRLTDRSWRQILVGLVLGALCMALIQSAFHFESGIVFDTRSVLLSVSGLFFGTLPTLVAMALTAAFRLLKGGGGAWTGVAVTFATGLIGIAWRRLRKGRLQDICVRELYALGLVAHLAMLALMLTLPWEHAKHVLHDISLPVLLIYPVAGTVLGLLLAGRLRRQSAVTDLTANEERLRLALDAAGMGTYDYDLQSQRITWSRTHEELWGFRPGEFAGTFESFATRVHPDDLPGIQAEMERCQVTRQPFVREFRVVWPDASVHWISAVGQYVYDDAGRALRFRGATMDITIRKRADDLRRESDERFRNLIQRSPVPTGLVESDKTVSLTNDRFSQLFGYTPADIPTIHDWWRRAFPDEAYRQKVMTAWYAALEKARLNNTVVGPLEFTVTAKDGARHVTETAGLPLPGGGVMVTFIDITARHEAETRQQHLTDVLRAIRNVNQLIVREKDPAVLLRQACGLLAESRGYRSAWIARRAADGQYQVDGESGVDTDFPELRKQLARGDIPDCCRQALNRPGVVVIHNTTATCKGCALAGSYADQSALATAIRHGTRIFGALVVALPRDMAADPEEQGLFAEVADDIGFALSSLETEQKRQQAEQELRFQKLILEETSRIAKIGGWFFDAQTGEGSWTDEVARIHDMAPGKGITREIGLTFYPPGSREIIRAAVAAAVADGTPYDLELELLSAKGVRKWVRTIGHPVKENGRVVRVQGSFQDISDQRRTSEALRTSEHQFRTFVENAPDAIYIQTKGCFAYLNPAAVKLFGAENEKQLLGTPVAERFPPDFRPRVAERIRRLNVDRQPASLLLEPVVRCDGTRVDAEFSGVPFEYQGQNGALIFVRDVTKRLQAEAKLHDTEIRRNMALEAARMGTWELDLATNRHLWSAEQEKLFGFEPGTFPGTTESFVGRIHPDDYANMKRTEAAALKTRLPFQFESRVTWPDGSLHWLATRAQYFFDSFNTPVRLTGVAYEITERKQAEAKLHESEMWRDMAVDAARLGMWDWNLVAHRIAWSPANEALWGFAPGTFPGTEQAFTDHVHPDDLPGLLQVGEKALREHRPFQTEFRVVWPDGTIHWLASHGQYHFDAAGNPVRLSGVALDITARMQAEAAARENAARLQLFIEHAPAALAMFDRDLRYLAASRRWLADYGLEGREILGRSHYEIFPEIGEELKQIHRRGLAGEVLRNNDDRFVRADGSVQYLRWEMLPWHDSRGEVGGIVIFTENITERKLAEEALRESKAHLSTALDMARAGYWEYDVASDIFTFNDSFYRVFKTTAAAVGGYQMSSREYAQRFCHPDDAPLVAREVAAAIASADPDYHRMIEHRILCGDGSVGHITVQFFVVQDDQGRTVKTYGVNQNITERKLNELRIREAKEFLDRVIDLSPYAMWVSDREGTILRVNRSLCESLSLPADKIVGQYNVLKDANLEKQGVMPRVRAVFAQHQPAQFSILWQPDQAGQVDFRGGRTLFMDVSIFPVLDAQGELTNVVCQGVDITERKRAEEALRESEMRFRILVDGAPEGIFVQAEGRFQYVNPALARLLGAGKPEDLVGTEYLARMAPEFHEAIRHRIRSQRETGTAAPPMEQAYLRLDGTRVPVETTAVPVRFGNRDAHLVFVRDISERQHTEAEKQNLQAQLAQAQKMDSVGRLAGGVAHDFNNMLGVILGHAEMALEDIPPQHPLFTYLQEIRKAAIRSGDLTRQLLAFARKQTVAPRVLDLNATVAGMLNMLRRLIGENIELAWQPDRAPLVIQMDPSQIDQVLANLCVNARDAIAGTGRITITSEAVSFDANYCASHPDHLPGDFVRLTVADTGCGMDAETLQHLFEPFFTTKELGKGTGLGLATVYGIVKQNNGFILVNSAPGQGATFKIHLPRHVATDPEPAPPPPPPPARGHETILLVEDEPFLLAMTGRMLEQLGYRVLPAATPAEAIRLANENPGRIQLLMTDVVMPEMNGRELAKRLLADHPGLKRLFMSGYTADIIALHGALDPGMHFIAKPYTPADLARKIREALAGPGLSGGAPATTPSP